MTTEQREARRDPGQPSTAARSRGGGRPPRGQRRRVRRTMSADSVWKGTLLSLAVFVVLASGNMVTSARGMPLGWQRDVAMGVAGAVDRVANFFSLNRPYDWAAEELGIDQNDADFEFPEETDLDVAGDPQASTTTTTIPPVRVPTAAAPLRVVVAGDSTAKSLGDTLIAETSGMPELALTNEGKVSTGLARSDYFNWGARMQEIVTQDDPEVVVFMVGANDGQSILEGDGTVVAQFGTPEWTEEYRRRVAGIMDLAKGGARRLIWVGEPNVGTGNVQKAVTLGNQLAEEEAAKRPWVSYFDLAALVAGPDGGFSEYITLPDGSTARCFAGDGVHLSVKCLDRVMGELVPTLTGLYAAAGTGGADSGVTTTTAATSQAD